ncbi:MAG TPA: [protein-PII] uridylyltransferase [Terriglobales bacterium]|nr:[protein-PII] uridylyltransferase [Terriglobales bacterium]
MTTASLSGELRDLYTEESARIQQQFAATGNGRSAVQQRTRLIETIALRLWQEAISPDPAGPVGFALVALGGFGRGWLFPHSDVDILFLHAGNDGDAAYRDAVRGFSQNLWDLHLKVSPATRTLAECDHFDAANVEFTISLLDCRYLAGDRPLFDRLHDKVILKLVMREAQSLSQSLADLARARHAKYGNTVFHLEPNVKDGPGGLRDYNVACWLSLISAIDNLRDWPDEKALLPVSTRKQFDSALDFLMSVRCFLHLRQGRDDNLLLWESQDEAAARKIGAQDLDVGDAAGWMRLYFGQARSVHRVCAQLLEEIPAAWSSLYRQFQNWRSRVSNSDFSVVDGLIFLQQPHALHDPEMLLRLFHFMAAHGLRLSTTTEYRIEQVLPSLAATPPRGAELWLYLGEILAQPHAADALRSMHALKLLTLLLPELKAIDALVVRDFYHRFTVDEHSFVAIESLHRLQQSQSEWDRRYAELLSELERPELLYLSLLLHDVGKGTPNVNHVDASLEIAQRCMNRLDLEPSERETVLFLIASHLDISFTLRRDIFDPETIRVFAEKVETSEHLKMLTLLTYADIKAVNPDALTPWKAENVFQLYIATFNYLNHSVDERLRADAEDTHLAHIRTLVPTAGRRLKTFLEGLPKRYLTTYSATDVLAHMEMAGRLGGDPIQLLLERGRHWFELTLVTNDRPALFAAVTGVLAAWGMNIVKANAFSNQAGTVVDAFYFTDRFRTLELNLQEWERFKRSIIGVLMGEIDLNRMLQDRLRAEKPGSAKIKVDTKIEFDDSCSARSTLAQVIAQDRPGLLHRIGSCLSEEKCNIEIALIDTEGQVAIDVFYLTSNGEKLRPEHQKRVENALLESLQSD